MELFLQLERWLTRLALAAAIVFLVVAATLAIYQVTTRFVLGHPSTWSEVVVRSTMIWSVFMGVAPSYRHGAMIAIEIIQTSLPHRAGLGLYMLANMLSIVFFCFLFWQGWGMTERVVSQMLAGLQISIAWVYAALPAGAVFAIVAILGCMARAVRDEKLPEPSVEAME